MIDYCCPSLIGAAQVYCYKLCSPGAMETMLKTFFANTKKFKLGNYACYNQTASFNFSGSENISWTIPSFRRLLQAPAAQHQALPDVQACLVGQFSARGDPTCSRCPLHATTVYPWNGMSDISACVCVPGYRAVRHSVTGKLEGCISCGRTGYSVYPSVNGNDTVCLQCPPGTENPTGMSSYCTCMDGKFRDGPESCAACPLGSYCQLEEILQCPTHSSSLAAGSRSQADCVCDPGFYFSYTSECMPFPLAVTCPPEQMVSTTSMGTQCGCHGGWTGSVRDGVLHCVPAVCQSGQYLRLPNTTSASLNITAANCVWCPLNTYAGGAAVWDPSKPDAQQCTPCPGALQTLTSGASSLDACVCSANSLSIRRSGNQTASCGTCPGNTIYDALNMECRTCPLGMVTQGSACVCPAGSQQYTDLLGTISCRPCPLGYYSAGLSSACVKCPAGRITLVLGATACLCGGGGFPKGGIC